jgi:hypothetical protein
MPWRLKLHRAPPPRGRCGGRETPMSCAENVATSVSSAREHASDARIPVTSPRSFACAVVATTRKLASRMYTAFAPAIAVRPRGSGMPEGQNSGFRATSDSPFALSGGN